MPGVLEETGGSRHVHNLLCAVRVSPPVEEDFRELLIGKVCTGGRLQVWEARLNMRTASVLAVLFSFLGLTCMNPSPRRLKLHQLRQVMEFVLASWATTQPNTENRSIICSACCNGE